ncbi:peptidyl serine alpha-galactosyltransferase isoform X3 [Setaria italica]|uniref:peptidyl serine alpha-galactosyltransferase isoform X3 n=1 Tax=Setaria italica TaxID=4555 RepID=UPI000BE578D7|nr:peptidyl serine alpha-galactosyltransferase isoform X3 [Setaria italica]XP_022678796.1 peptidyl serine alpha-galactosyltransferase isoform X3 [Setaria italica]XP_022678797.1 peptidyl serine alpha-galactosyltransferase isoform X3 [Setaria italica]
MSSLSSSSELPRRRQPPARLRRRNAADANQLKIDTPATSTAQPGVPLRPAPAAPRLLRSPPSRPPPPSAGEPPEPPSRPGEHRKSAAEPWHGKERTKVEGRNKNKLQLEKGDCIWNFTGEVTVQRTIMWLYPEDLLVLRLHIS